MRSAARTPVACNAARTGGEGRTLVGAAVEEEHEAAGGGADRQPREQLRRHPVRDDELQDRERGADERAGPAPAEADERSEDDERADDLRERTRVHGDEVRARVPRDLGHDPVVRGRVQPLHRPRHHDAGDDVAGQEIPEQAVALRQERRDQHREDDEAARELAGAGDEALGRRRDELEQAEDVAFDAEQSLLRPAGEGEEEERERTRT